MQWALASNFLIAMLAIVNPLGKVPLWVVATAGERQAVLVRMALLTTGTGGIILALFLLFGQDILGLFGIDQAAFRVGGGIVVFATAFAMLRGEAIHVEHREADLPQAVGARAKVRFREVAVPLVFPMIAGPASISTAMIYGSQVNGWASYLPMLAALALALVLVMSAFLFSRRIQSWVGDTALSVFTRLFGLILAAIAAQLVLEGLGQAFPQWLDGSSQVADDVADDVAGSSP